MDGAGLRGARIERRCAGVVDGTGLWGGEMSKAPLDDLGSLDAGDSCIAQLSGFSLHSRPPNGVVGGRHALLSRGRGGESSPSP